MSILKDSHGNPYIDKTVLAIIIKKLYMKYSSIELKKDIPFSDLLGDNYMIEAFKGDKDDDGDADTIDDKWDNLYPATEGKS